MAITSTTLGAALRVSDLTATLADATGAVVGNTILIGGEYMRQTGDAIGLVIPVARGLNGSAQIAHAASVTVRMGLASDFTIPDPIQAGVYVDATLTGDGSSARPLSAVGDGTGDVVGPAVAVSGDVASFSGTTGKLIADSGKVAASLVTGPASVTAGKVAVFSGTTGKIIAADAAGVTAGPFTVITSITVTNGLVTALTGS